MGYKPPTTGQKLTFEGSGYEGLEVTVDSVPLGTLLDISEKFQMIDAEDIAGQREVITLFAGLIESWNVEDDDGNPVPPGLEGLLRYDMPFTMAIIGAWVGSTTAAPPPLPSSSDSGATSPEVLTAMGELSASLPSLPPPKSS